MFIIDLKYIQPLSEIENLLPKHIEFLNRNYENGNLLMSGRKNPRNGDMMFCDLKTQEEVLKMISEDPFKINNLAKYTITEFLPTKTCEYLKFLMPKK